MPKNSPKSIKQAHDKAWWPLIVFFFVIIVAVCAVLFYKYFHKSQKYSSVSSFEFSTYTGPVSPEFQETKKLTISANGCEYKVTKYQESTSQSCKISTANYAKIIDSYFANKISTKIEYNNNSAQQSAIGGPSKKMSANVADGTILTTNVIPDFATNAQPFFSTVQQYVPEFSKLGF